MLNYLHFDYGEDTEGVGALEAMASTWPEQVPAVQAEMARVLDWAHATFPGQRGPVGDGGEWDYDLQAMQEFTAPETIRYDEITRQFSVHPGVAGKPRHTVTIFISGTSEFCSAFRQQFGLE
ncbi:MAG: hypothetical protein WAW69_15820 [Polaromonas sp.]